MVSSHTLCIMKQKKNMTKKAMTVKQARMSNKNKKIVLLSELQNMLLSQLFKNVGVDVGEIKFQIRCFTLTPPPPGISVCLLTCFHKFQDQQELRNQTKRSTSWAPEGTYLYQISWHRRVA